MNNFDINNPAPTPPATRAVLTATNAEHAEYLEDLAQPGGALWHSPLDRARVLHIAERLRVLGTTESRLHVDTWPSADYYR